GDIRAQPVRQARDQSRRRGNPEFLKQDALALQQLASRLAYIYVARDRVPYPPATIDEGLSFAFRKERVVAHPLAPDQALDGYYPVNNSTKAGLPGGVDWGFESKNIYDEVLGSRSTSGRVVAPALTALGGFGFQKASFANDKSRIY